MMIKINKSKKNKYIPLYDIQVGQVFKTLVGEYFQRLGDPIEYTASKDKILCVCLSRTMIIGGLIRYNIYFLDMNTEVTLLDWKMEIED